MYFNVCSLAFNSVPYAWFSDVTEKAWSQLFKKCVECSNCVVSEVRCALVHKSLKSKDEDK